MVVPVPTELRSTLESASAPVEASELNITSSLIGGELLGIMIPELTSDTLTELRQYVEEFSDFVLDSGQKAVENLTNKIRKINKKIYHLTNNFSINYELIEKRNLKINEKKKIASRLHQQWSSKTTKAIQRKQQIEERQRSLLQEFPALLVSALEPTFNQLDKKREKIIAEIEGIECEIISNKEEAQKKAARLYPEYEKILEECREAIEKNKIQLDSYYFLFNQLKDYMDQYFENAFFLIANLIHNYQDENLWEDFMREFNSIFSSPSDDFEQVITMIKSAIEHLGTDALSMELLEKENQNYLNQIAQIKKNQDNQFQEEKERDAFLIEKAETCKIKLQKLTSQKEELATFIKMNQIKCLNINELNISHLPLNDKFKTPILNLLNQVQVNKQSLKEIEEDIQYYKTQKENKEQDVYIIKKEFNDLTQEENKLCKVLCKNKDLLENEKRELCKNRDFLRSILDSLDLISKQYENMSQFETPFFEEEGELSILGPLYKEWKRLHPPPLKVQPSRSPEDEEQRGF